MRFLRVSIFLISVGPIMRRVFTVSEFAAIYSYWQVVLELQDDLKLATSDDPPAVLGSLDLEFTQKVSLIIDFNFDMWVT